MIDTILLTGGAGYIGSHTYLSLINKGFKVVILDNFSNCDPIIIENLKKITNKNILFEKNDLSNQETLAQVFKKHKVNCVIHFAAYKNIEESINFPLKYYENNINNFINLLSVMDRVSCKYLIYSSSASVYAMNESPISQPINEKDKLETNNPYAYSKMIGEKLIQDLANQNGLTYSILRYFNPAGSHESGVIGDNPLLSSGNLFPNIKKVITGDKPHLEVYGDDYPTRDGSAIRDYIHISDLVSGHVMALNDIIKKNRSHIINLGSGKGYSVFDVINGFESVIGKKINYKIHPRRKGDKPSMFADIKLAEQLIGWRPKRSLIDMCTSSFNIKK